MTTHEQVQQVAAQINQHLLGKTHAVKLALCCLIAKGHLLLDDLPGMGKTTLAHCLAHTMAMTWQRLQFTSDLLPADILGGSVFNANNQSFHYQAGPIFKHLLLIDEINRASPKTQSALLEVMAERQVTVDGETYPLPIPFMVIATQNPHDQFGTFPLPESQLDRFLMCISLGYPALEDELTILKQKSQAQSFESQPFEALLKPADVIAIQAEIMDIKTSDSLLHYLMRLVQATREHPSFCGLSTRGALAICQSAKAWAWLAQRTYVIPEDIQAVFVAVSAHRLGGDLSFAREFCQQLLQTTDTSPIISV